MHDEPMSAARERVLLVAEQQFLERGYAAVTLNDIAAALHIKKASLYHHVPNGKEALFAEVLERSLDSHARGLSDAIGHAGPTLRAQLTAVAAWLLSHPPINLARLTRADLPALSPPTAHRLTRQVYDALLAPVEHMFVAAGITRPEPGLLAGMVLFMLEALHDAQRYSTTPRAVMIDEMVTMVLHGLEPR